MSSWTSAVKPFETRLKLMADIHLSVVIPVFNEENRIGPTLDALVAFLRGQPYSFEIVVVDDGSSDRSVQVAREKLRGQRHRLLESQRNFGKGHAVRRGMLAAEGRFVLFTDADLSTPIEEVNGFLRALQSDFDLVIGSRDVPESRVEVHQSFLREGMGKVFNRLARLFSFGGIHDSQCGFKCFRREAARDLFARQKLHGFAFDAEILYLAQKKGCRILEAPVTWRNSPQSRVSILLDPLRMLWDLVRIRWIHR